MGSHNEACPDQEFITLFTDHGAAETSRILGVAIRNVYARRANLERLYGNPINGPRFLSSNTASTYPKRLTFDVENGVVMVGSDAHYWPGEKSTAHRAFVKLAGLLRPKATVLNGDVLDGASISRHPSIMWEKKPSLKEEVEAVYDSLAEIRRAAPNAENFWTLGNHDARFESKLSKEAGAFEGVTGMRLADHFPDWTIGWTLWINNEVVIKHRFKGGIHATHNNTLWAGKTMVTGHLHSLKVTPFTTYGESAMSYPRTRFGVDTGTMAEQEGPQFGYMEDNPSNHRSGFIVLTFKDGALLWPEIAHVIQPGKVEFRGNIIDV